MRNDASIIIPLFHRWAELEYQRNVAPLVERCESPAEELLLFGFLSLPCVTLHPDATYDIVGMVSLPPRSLALSIQHPVGRYRLDFAIGTVGIEVDGAAYHEGSRDQIRDRALLAAGWPVERFQASDVWRDPSACAEAAVGLAGRHYERMEAEAS